MLIFKMTKNLKILQNLKITATSANLLYLNLKQFNLVKNRSSPIYDLILSNANNIIVFNEPFLLLFIVYT